LALTVLALRDALLAVLRAPAERDVLLAVLRAPAERDVLLVLREAAVRGALLAVVDESAFLVLARRGALGVLLVAICLLSLGDARGQGRSFQSNMCL